jgi:sporulation protein YlmC with PRC-barrel domain
MLRSLREILGYKIQAADGELGKVSDFYFDDSTWRVRYLVVKTGSWLFDREVLIPPATMGEPDWERRRLPVKLTMAQVSQCPPIDADLPVSRQKELQIARHYQIIPYWEGSPGLVMVPIRVPLSDDEGEPPGDPHLRSVTDVRGYRIHASDGDIGHVGDFLAQTDAWAIRYLVVGLGRLLPARKVLISPAWASSVVWNAKRVHVDTTAEQVRGSQPFDPSAPVNREYEARLYDYYGRPKYWESEKARAEQQEAASVGAAASSGSDDTDAWF